jgi:AcrR family transcriptional regulator
MNDIAERCELSKATLYLYFKSKEELALNIMIKHLEIMKANAFEAAEKAESGFGKIKAALQSVVLLHFKNQNLFRFMANFDSFITPDAETGSLVEQCFSVVDAMRLMFVDFYMLGIRDGSLASGVNIEKKALMAQHLVISFIQYLSAKGDFIESRTGYSTELLLEACLDLILDSIIREPNKAEKK